MDKPIFETSLFGLGVRVFPSYLAYKKGFLGREQSIPFKQIASVESTLPGVQQIVIETAGGKKIKIFVRLRDKKALHDAILSNL